MSTSESLTCPQCAERVPTDYVVCPYCGYSLVQVIREQIKVRITLRETFGRVRRAFNPLGMPQLMTEIASNPDRRGGFLMIFLMCGAFLLKIGSLYYQIDNVPSYTGGPDVPLWLFLLIIPFLGSIPLLIIGIITNFLFALFVWMLSKLLGGKGSYKETTSFVGYSLAPIVAGLVIGNFLGIVLGAFSSGTASSATEALDAGIIGLADLLLAPFAVLTLYYLATGIMKSHRVDRTTAIGITVIIGGGFLMLFFVPNII